MLNSVQKLFEVRLNKHSTHAEDLILLGKEGFGELIEKYKSLASILEGNTPVKQMNTTVKIEGAPALICWTSFPGIPGPGVCLKAFLNAKSAESLEVFTSPEQVIEKYGDRPNMVAMVNAVLQALISKTLVIPENEAWQGDCIFAKDSLEYFKQDGDDYITFQPNTILYAVPANSETGKKIAASDAGIAFHTKYTGFIGSLSQSFNIHVNEDAVALPDNVFIIDCNIPNLSGQASFTKEESQVVYEMIDELKEAYIQLTKNYRLQYEAVCSAEDFIKMYFQTYQNHIIADEQNKYFDEVDFIEKLEDYCMNKVETQRTKKPASLETQKSIDTNNTKFDSLKSELIDIIENEPEVIQWIVSAINTAVEIKQALMDKMTQAKMAFEPYYRTENGIEAGTQEDITVSDIDGNMVKLVDRTCFSFHNCDVNTVKGWQHPEQKVAESCWSALEYHLCEATRKADKEQGSKPKKRFTEAESESEGGLSLKKLKLTVAVLKNNKDLLDAFTSELGSHFIKEIGEASDEKYIFTKSGKGDVCVKTGKPTTFVYDGVSYEMRSSGLQDEKNNYKFSVEPYEIGKSEVGANVTNTQEFLKGAALQMALRKEPYKKLENDDGTLAKDGDDYVFEKVLGIKVKEDKITTLDTKNWKDAKDFESVYNGYLKADAEIKNAFRNIDKIIRCDSECEHKTDIEKLFKAVGGSKDDYAPADVYGIDSLTEKLVYSEFNKAIQAKDQNLFVETSNKLFEAGYIVPVSMKKGDSHFSYINGDIPNKWEVNLSTDFDEIKFNTTGNNEFYISNKNIDLATGQGQHHEGKRAKFEFRTKGTNMPWQCNCGFEKEKAYTGGLKSHWTTIFSSYSQKDNTYTYKELDSEKYRNMFKDVYDKLKSLLGGNFGKVVKIDNTPVDQMSKEEFVNKLVSAPENKPANAGSTIQGRIGMAIVLLSFIYSYNGKGLNNKADIATVIRRGFKADNVQNSIKIQ